MGRTLRGSDEEFPYVEEFGAEKNNHFGYIGDQVVDDMFGTIAPAGFELDSDGALRRPGPATAPPSGPRHAAAALTGHIANTYGIAGPTPKSPYWASGNSWVVPSLGAGYERGLDAAANRAAVAHKASVFKVTPKTGGNSSYVFTDSPWTSRQWAKMYSMNVKAIKV